VHQDGNYGPDAFRNTQPVNADESVKDMVGAIIRAMNNDAILRFYATEVL